MSCQRPYHLGDAAYPSPRASLPCSRQVTMRWCPCRGCAASGREGLKLLEGRGGALRRAAYNVVRKVDRSATTKARYGSVLSVQYVSQVSRSAPCISSSNTGNNTGRNETSFISIHKHQDTDPTVGNLGGVLRPLKATVSILRACRVLVAWGCGRTHARDPEDVTADCSRT